MSATDLISLPISIFFEIVEYCDASAVMALTLTHRSLKTAIENMMFVIHGPFGFGGKERMIPVFDADHCHSVFLKCELKLPSDIAKPKIVVLSRTKHQQEPFATIVWQRTNTVPDYCRRHRRWISHIGFRNDPTKEYVLRHDFVEHSYERPIVTVRKQFMTRSVTPTRTRAITACLAMGTFRLSPWHAIKVSGIDVIRLFRKLFVHSFNSATELSSPIHTFFGGEHSPTDQMIPRQINNLFEQILEQEEPKYCRKVPCCIDYATNKNLIYTWHGENPTTRLVPELKKVLCCVPSFILTLNKKFKWERDMGQRLAQNHFIQEELEFVARIPVPETTLSFTLNADFATDSHDGTRFVMFFQSDLENLETTPSYGKVFTVRSRSRLRQRRFLLNHGCEACFLYVVPTSASWLVIKNIEI